MMLQKRLAADVLKCGNDRVRLDPSQMEEITKAITKYDVRKLISKGLIMKVPAVGTSRVRARKIHAQKQKGRRRGSGSRKGSKGSRVQFKKTWMATVRIQREFLNKIKYKGLITHDVYKQLYVKITGRFFRSITHLKLFINEQHLIKK